MNVILIQCEDNIMGYTNSIEACRNYVKTQWDYTDEKIEEDMKDGLLAFTPIDKLETS